MADLVVAVGALAGWFLIYAMCRVATRPAAPEPAPATMELGPESPALVSLLVNRWQATEDAAEATLLDLAARKFLELRQPGDDPMQTTVHVPAAGPRTAGLRPYESQVLDRIRRLAVGGVVPITALTFRDRAESKNWNSRLRSDVIAEARAAGLSRRRFGRVVMAVLLVSAAVASLVIGLAAYRYGVGRATDDRPGGFGTGVVALLVLAAVAARPMGERDTPAGLEVASRWLGVRAWLRGHEQFADLPPAAVAIWDRYLAYGAAVGVTRLASAVLDLEMGDRRLVWSSFGGTWHRIRVRYPSLWPRYGRKTSRLVLRGLLAAVAGGVALKFLGAGDRLGGDHRFAFPAVLVLLFGVYVLVRALTDLITAREITGEVLWRETWKSRSGGEDEPPIPWLDYLAVDDGSADRTTAWGVPVTAGTACHDGDTVTITVRPWSRRVTALTVVGRGHDRQIDAAVDPDATGDLARQMTTAPETASFPAPGRAETLLSLDDLARAFGRPVVAQPFPTGIQYRAADTGRPLMLAQVVAGLPGRVLWRAQSRGTALPSGGYLDGDNAAFRLGDRTVVFHLTGEGRAARPSLPWLLERAAPAGPAG